MGKNVSVLQWLLEMEEEICGTNLALQHDRTAMINSLGEKWFSHCCRSVPLYLPKFCLVSGCISLKCLCLWKNVAQTDGPSLESSSMVIQSLSPPILVLPRSPLASWCPSVSVDQVFAGMSPGHSTCVSPYSAQLISDHLFAKLFPPLSLGCSSVSSYTSRLPSWRAKL